MKRHKVVYEVKDKRNLLVQKVEIFPDFKSANDFVRSIKSVSFTKPVLEEVK
jgi:hypothetical protein